MQSMNRNELLMQRQLERRLRIESMTHELRECIKLLTIDHFTHEIPIGTNLIIIQTNSNEVIAKIVKVIMIFDESAEAIDETVELFARVEMYGCDDRFDINMNKKEIGRYMAENRDRLHRINRVLLTDRELCEVFSIHDEFDPTDPDDQVALYADLSYEPFKIFLQKFENKFTMSQQCIILTSTFIYMKHSVI